MRIRRGALGLQLRINLVVMAIILLSVGIQTIAVRQFIEGYIIAEGERKVARIASKTAKDERIVDGDGVTTIVRLPKNRLKLRTQERA